MDEMLPFLTFLLSKMSKLSVDISIEIRSSDWLTVKRTQMAQQIKDVCRYEGAQGQISDC